NNFHKLRWFTEERDDIELFSPVIFFPPSRALAGNFTIPQQSLKSVDYYNTASAALEYESKSKNITFGSLAVTHFGRKKMQCMKRAASSRKDIADELFSEDSEVKALTTQLSKIGYGWTIEEQEMHSQYHFLLTKSGSSFDLAKASSGEQEILNFLLGIFALNVQGGVVFIDEPEIHLHPKWQSLLLDIFINISVDRANQFIFSTHSPTFVNPNTYNNLIRIYKKNNESRAVVLKEVEPFDLKDILHIINGTNNEKMFFADSVVLVEGITDRLVFSKIIDNIVSENNSDIIIEVIEVKGKTNLDKFRRFLQQLSVPTFFIADLDFVNEVGTKEIKELFVVNDRKIEKDVIRNEKSKDGGSLVTELDDAIKNENLQCLQKLWSYIKSLRRKPKPNMEGEDKDKLYQFIDEQEEDNNYILKLGDIEDYFPEGFRSKNLDNVISLLKDEQYNQWKEDETGNYKYLHEFAAKIFDKSI
ncbi:MAG: AAA family ATPase, partial [Kangiellaceae bacterium]|nr:AAA family ATPase [Kangiellaceae bacterium]